MAPLDWSQCPAVESVPGRVSGAWVFKEPSMVKKDGYVDVPKKPGWGVALNEEAFKSMPPQPWRRGANFRADSSPYFQ